MSRKGTYPSKNSLELRFMQMTPKELAEKIFFVLRGFKPVTDVDLEEVGKLESLLEAEFTKFQKTPTEALAEAENDGFMKGIHSEQIVSKREAYEDAAKIVESIELDIYEKDWVPKLIAEKIRRRAEELKNA